MRKKIIMPAQQQATAPVDEKWLNLEALAEVELTSEDAAHPLECALQPGHVSGWRAATAGKQTLRFRFDQPQAIRRIWLHFAETGMERTQEYVLRWSPDDSGIFRDIVRQQWNFSAASASTEIEDHRVELPAVRVLELCINPDISGGSATASLVALRLA